MSASSWLPARRAQERARSAGHSEYAIGVRDLRVSFGGLIAVDGVTFDIPRGKATGLIGPNGAGKSTVLRVMSGWMRCNGGRVMLQGEDVTRCPANVLARRGLMRTFQISSEFGHLTVLENLLVAVRGQAGDSLHGALLGSWRWRAQERRNIERAMELLERFQMVSHADHYAAELSGGEKRLVEIMRALMAEPSVLLLDEPLAGINPTLCETIEAHLRSLRDDGLTMVIVEHELGVIERVCDSVIVMASGRVLAEGSMESLRANPEVVDAYLVG